MTFVPTRTTPAGRRRRRIGVTASLAAGILVVAAACGSSSSQGGAGGAAPAHFTITVGQSSATYDGAPEKVVESNGDLKAKGITEKDVLLSSSNTLLAGIVSGGVDFGLTNAFSVLAARQTGVPVVAVCGTYAGIHGLALVVSSKLTKNLNLTEGDVNGDLKKLKGQPIGVSSPSSTGGKIVTGLLKSAGLAPNWVKLVSLSTNDSVSALQHGEIAGFIGNIPNPQQAVADGTGTIAFDMSQVPQLGAVQYDVIVTSEKFIKAHPAEVKAFLQVIGEGEADLAAKKPAAMKAISGIFNNGLPASVIDTAATTGVQKNCSMPASGWQAAATATNKYGLANKTVTPSQVTAAYKTGL